MDHRHIATERIDMQLLEIDRRILEQLAGGRGSPSYIADEIGENQPWVSQRLTELVDAEIVTRVHRGLYELNAEYKREGPANE